MIQRLINLWAAIALLVGGVIVIAAFILWSEHFTARSIPSDLEARASMKVYDSSIPSKYEAMADPISASSLDLVEAGGHYEEHCAVCHGDDGSGKAKFHGTLYPRPTDLRSKDTQEMSDGELYWVIKNGVRWSGMPAFGKPGDDDNHAWKIVVYVRHLPMLTPAEEQQVLHKAEEPMNHDEHSHEHAR